MTEIEFPSIKIPLVRRIYPQLITNKLVEVQPLLSGPNSLVYYLRHRYSSNKRFRMRTWTVRKRWKYENKAGRLASRASVDLQEAA